MCQRNKRSAIFRNVTFICIPLAGAFIQSDLQMRNAASDSSGSGKQAQEVLNVSEIA